MLCERFRMTGQREPSQPMMRRYFDYLNDRMETPEFLEAAARIYGEAEFFPKPADFLPDGGRRGALQWEKVFALLHNSASPLDSLDPAARRTVRAMGGLAAIGADERTLHYRQSAFLGLYADLSDAPDTPAELLTDGQKLIGSVTDGAP